jgi:hypothetical protein
VRKGKKGSICCTSYRLHTNWRQLRLRVKPDKTWRFPQKGKLLAFCQREKSGLPRMYSLTNLSLEY